MLMKQCVNRFLYYIEYVFSNKQTGKENYVIACSGSVRQGRDRQPPWRYPPFAERLLQTTAGTLTPLVMTPSIFSGASG